MADESTGKWMKYAEKLNRFRGHFVRTVTFTILHHEDSVDIGLLATPGDPELVIRAEGVYHFSVNKPEDASGAFVDEFLLQHVPQASASWPKGIPGPLGPRPGMLPDLFWLQIVGPATIDIVARFLTIAESE